MRDIGRRVAGWLVTRRALLDELVAVEQLADERLISLQASEAARRDLERDEIDVLIGVAQALGRALHSEDDGEQFWNVCIELGKDFPQISWHNSMTDGGSKAKPV